MAREKRARRIDVRMYGTLWPADGGSFPVTVLDLSARGFRIEVQEPRAVGERGGLGVGWAYRRGVGG